MPLLQRDRGFQRDDVGIFLEEGLQGIANQQVAEPECRLDTLGCFDQEVDSRLDPGITAAEYFLVKPVGVETVGGRLLLSPAPTIGRIRSSSEASNSKGAKVANRSLCGVSGQHSVAEMSPARAPPPWCVSGNG